MADGEAEEQALIYAINSLEANQTGSNRFWASPSCSQNQMSHSSSGGDVDQANGSNTNSIGLLVCIVTDEGVDVDSNLQDFYGNCIEETFR